MALANGTAFSTNAIPAVFKNTSTAPLSQPFSACRCKALAPEIGHGIGNQTQDLARLGPAVGL
ncbi:hypothetical protein SIAM614_20096 [Stappia aggregata IAM 12614]|uniref:Uncharacterized protein n=1 Tax=Roseibium aggregatum (strain ATCC 25650 / DSM 13394 / JCM 20685 / NBRC 16684 / NCIMB 2208 / IAM 12614 / B1) TaxID=384765 RepID=A0NVZ6_ROSAI|nr:hypothetical protein SIAM614_20096 [Stappia aggregata IAM 12614] [Roseibium aggregatum IAM 12614]